MVDGELCCAFGIQLLVAIPVSAIVALNELIAPEMSRHCGYSPSLFIRVLLLVDLVILTFIGWSLISAEPFQAFKDFCIDFGEVIDMMRDILVYVHILTPAVSLVMLLTYHKSPNCDSDYKVPTLYMVFYWVFFGMQVLFALLIILYIWLVHRIPFFSEMREYMLVRRDYSNFRRAFANLSLTGLERYIRISEIFGRASNILLRTATIPLLKTDFSVSLNGSHIRTLEDQGRICTICKESFLLRDEAILAPGCRHLFHTSCFLSRLAAGQFCVVCRSHLTRHIHTEIMTNEHMTKPLFEQEIAVVPAVPPSHGQTFKNARMNRHHRFFRGPHV